MQVDKLNLIELPEGGDLEPSHQFEAFHSTIRLGQDKVAIPIRGWQNIQPDIYRWRLSLQSRPNRIVSRLHCSKSNIFELGVTVEIERSEREMA